MKVILGTTKCCYRAFALVDLIILLGTIALGVLWFVNFYSRPAKKRGPRTLCMSNQRNIGLAFRIWANEHDDKYPFRSDQSVEPFTGTSLFQNATNVQTWMHFQLLSNAIQSARIFACPADRVRIDNAAGDFLNGPTSLSCTNKRNMSVSYFIGLGADESMPNAIMAGDRNLSYASGMPLYGSSGGARKIHSRSSWSSAGTNLVHNNAGNALMVDGSVQQVSIESLQGTLKWAERNYGTNANTFLFPQ